MAAHRRGTTQVSIRGDDFILNGRPTYPGVRRRGARIEGLLLNSRMINAVFDDANPETRRRWAYPDIGAWDPWRNTAEFIGAMPSWRNAGLLAVTVGVQGGNPAQYTIEQPWVNPGYSPDGRLLPDYQKRLAAVLDRADELGMVVILNPFYFGQDGQLADDHAVREALSGICRWVLGEGWRNVMLDIVNECNIDRYTHNCLRSSAVHHLIEQARGIEVGGRRLLAGTSFAVVSRPTPAVVHCSDIIFLHGNEVDDPRQIEAMIQQVRTMPEYGGQPLVFNEDDHFDFGAESNNMMTALRAHTSWGYFDPGRNDYADGYQSVPVRWDINTPRKRDFFGAVGALTHPPQH
jgi:hypothetical protein